MKKMHCTTRKQFEEYWNANPDMNQDLFELLGEEITLTECNVNHTWIMQEDDDVPAIGIIFDEYDENSENVRTSQYWYDDFIGDEIFTTDEIKAFKKTWGQSHSNACAELGYSKKTSDDLLMLDFFWVDEDRKWYNKESSLFTEREQQIADYLRNM